MGRSAEGPAQTFPPSSLVYLSPDAGQPLEAPLDPNKVYVIGGLSDGTVAKGTSLGYADSAQIECRRLPIEEHCSRRDGGGTFSQVLTINAVFDILLHMLSTESDSWQEVFQRNLPERTGWVVKASKTSS